MARRRSAPPAHGGPLLAGAVAVTGVYGGYFGAAQGVLLIALLGTFLADDLQRLNAAKNVLALTANLVAACLFIVGHGRRLGGGGTHRGGLDRRRAARREGRPAPPARRAARR